MGIEVKETTISGAKVETTLFDARNGIKIGAKLIKYAAPILMPLFGGMAGGKQAIEGAEGGLLDIDLNDGLIVEAVKMLVGSLDEDDIVEFVLRLLSTTRIDSKELTPEQFDVTFAGKYGMLIQVIVFAIKSNNFLDKSGITGVIDMVSIATK